jgi:hypothetical protein
VVDQYPGPNARLLTKPLDFGLCGKNSVCRKSLDDTANLRARIIYAIPSAAKEILTHRRAALAYRPDVRTISRVSHAEVDKRSHEHLELRNDLKFCNLSTFWLPRNIFFKIRTGMFSILYY